MGKYDVGNRFTNIYGTEYEIIEYVDYYTRIIKFLDKYNHKMQANINCIRDKSVKNPYDTSVYGIGKLGDTSTVDNDGNRLDSYVLWRNMLKRCYRHYNNSGSKYYENCSVCDEWLVYSNFKLWYEKTIPKHINEVFNLDKDLMQLNVKNKIYSPETCVWLPRRINVYLIKFSNSKGCYFNKRINKWVSQGIDFYTGKHLHYGLFKSEEDAITSYLINKEIQNSLARKYLFDLNYLSEDIINLITLK